MASFGRLEIYQPESAVENYIFPKDVVAIGRQQGNDIVIDRNGISRYHVTLRFTDNQMVLQDLDAVNGTYIDGLRLKPNESRVLRGGEEIQLGDVRLVYYPPETLLQDTVPVEHDLTQHIKTDLMMVHLTGSDMVVIPGSNVQLTLLLENLSQEPERYKVTIEGVPKEWIRLDRPEFELTPGAQTQLVASFKPLRRSESQPGTYPITFIIQPFSKPEGTIRLETSVEVGLYSGYGVVMGTAMVEGNDRFQMHIHNQGNGPLRVSFRGADPTGALQYTLHPPEVTLKAGERRVIEGSIRPQQGMLLGSPREYQYDVITLAHDSSGFQAAVSGKYLYKPLLPGWTMTLAIPVVAFLILGLLGGLLMLLNGDDAPAQEANVVPGITAFSITSNQTDVILGEPVLLEWQIADARTVNISYHRPEQPVQEVTVEDPSTQAYQLLLDETGVYNVTLTVENNGGRDSRLLQVRVLPRIHQLEADPPTLLRYVTQDVKFSWEVEGAAMANGTPDISLSSLEIPIIQGVGMQPEGTETYSIRPGEMVTVTLLVRGNDGTESSQSWQFALEDPRCLLSNPSATLYTGPGENYPPLTKLDQPETVVNPIARNTQNTWLQVRHADSAAWVRVADFTCEGFRTTQLDPELDIPPTPTPPPTFTPAPTNTRRPTQPPASPTRPPRTPTVTPTPT